MILSQNVEIILRGDPIGAPLSIQNVTSENYLTKIGKYWYGTKMFVFRTEFRICTMH